MTLHIFNDDYEKSLERINIDTLGDDSLTRDARFYSDSLMSLMKNENHVDGNRSSYGKLDSRGYTFVISGTWGVGKTTVANAIVNTLCRDEELGDRIIFIEKSFLPFGNINESMTLFLGEVARKLSDRNITDIRPEIGRFIMESTTDSELANVSASVMGVLSISKSFNKGIVESSYGKIKEKMTSLSKNRNTLVLLIDDLDRLRPDEVTAVLRMAEKLRQLPRVLIILPVFKSIISSAIASDLKIKDSAAATFLRKLTDVTMYIDNDLSSLRDMFIYTLKEGLSKEYVSKRPFGVEVADLCWLVLLHVVIIYDTLADFDSLEAGSVGLTSYALDLKNSRYIRAMYNQLRAARSSEAYNPYPVYGLNSGRESWCPLAESDYMSNLISENDSGLRKALEGMLYDEAYTVSLVSTDRTVVDHLKTSSVPMDFDRTVEEQSSSPIFIAFMKQFLGVTKDEPAVTNNYKKRDIGILASMTSSALKREFDSITDDANRKEVMMWGFIRLVRDEFIKFRNH